MKRFFKITLWAMLISMLWVSRGSGQARIIDRIAAVVGEFYILQSDIESMYIQNRAQGITSTGDMKCEILEEYLSQKLMVNQARIDSVEISESTVEIQLDSRLQYFINMVGSPEALEEYFDKNIIEIKEDMRESVREQLITQQMNGTITADVTVTPSEVRAYFNKLPPDSVPYINSKVEIAQIMMYPPADEEAIFEVKQFLLELRRRILDGENFATLAVLYSEDPGNAPRGGDLGFFGRGEMDPTFTKAVFSLKTGGISPVVESVFGFHLIQLIERKEDRVHARHILRTPEVNQEALIATRNKLDSIADLIRKDSLSFELAARMYSQDRHTAVNGGLMVNPMDNTTRFELDQLEAEEYVALRDLGVEEITSPFESEDENRKQVYKIIKILSQSEPHRANLKEDYNVLKAMALQDKKDKIFQDWLNERIEGTFIRIDESFAGCPFSNQAWLQD
jgi:peptidyl-prolyl cis-trans isomerase SurA